MTEQQRPLRRDAERNRRRILAAAREVFAARGVDVTLDDIAHHAGLGVGTVYRRYPSREHLVEALFEEALDALTEGAEQAAADPDPWAALSGFMERSAEAMVGNRGLQDVLSSRVYGQDHVARARARMDPAGDALVVRCQEAGLLRPGVSGTDLAIINYLMGAMLEYSEHDQPGLWRRYLTLLLDGLRKQPDGGPLPHPAVDAEALDRIARHWKPPRRTAPIEA